MTHTIISPNFFQTNTTIIFDPSFNPNQQQSFRLNSDQNVPMANVIMISAANARIPGNTKETLQEYVGEFISFVIIY